MVTRTLISLAEWHLHLELIGTDEFEERIKVADWLRRSARGGDPRDPAIEHEFDDRADEVVLPSTCSSRARDSSRDDTVEDDYEDDHIELVWFGWVFTRQDADPYPSTPHGHDQSPNRSWPKLNPYTGRVFAHKHQEDVKRRLTKKKLITLWSNLEFREFCRSHVLWYMEAHPHHAFSVRRPLRFPWY